MCKMMLNEALRLIRVFHDMTAKELAEKLGISVAQLSKIETGKTTPQLNILEKYADIFQTTTPSLLLFADNLDKEKGRGKFKITIRNKMFSLLKVLEGLADDSISKSKK